MHGLVPCGYQDSRLLRVRSRAVEHLAPACPHASRHVSCSLMLTAESFKLEIEGHSVEGTICLPEKPAEQPVPTVLLCRNLVDHDPTIDQLWDAFIDRALERTLAVVSFEPRCSHLILDDFDAYDLEDYWRDVERVLNHISTQEALAGAPLAVVGYRLGSLAALRLAAMHPEISRVCLVSPMLDGRYVSGEIQPEANGRSSPAHLPKRMLESLGEFDAADMAGACDSPVLLLHGAADRTTPPEQSIEYDRTLQAIGVRTRLELIARADHTFSQPEARQACIDRLVRFCTAG
jgi:pimeloyl-ACP methyl ester carboxylesterase